MVQAEGIAIGFLLLIFCGCVYGDCNRLIGIRFLLIGFPQSCNFQLGANAILAVSLAVCKAGALAKKIPLYKVCEVSVTIVSILLACFSWIALVYFHKHFSILQISLETRLWYCLYLHSMLSTEAHMQEISLQCR